MKWVRLALVPLCLIIIGVVKILRPWVLIRFGEIYGPRIGHLAANMECYFCEKDEFTPKSIDFFSLRERVCNEQLFKMIKRRIHFDPTNLVSLIITVFLRFRGWKDHLIETTQQDRDVHNFFEKYPPKLTFTEKELRQGKEGLAKMGIPNGAKWVCLIVRDSAYLRKHSGTDCYSYHNYRDSEIATYRKAVIALANRGYYGLRMGESVSEELAVDHPKVIDYATNGMRTDFMDIYLGAHCEFCISTATGFDAIPVIFRRPVCFVNQVPVEYLSTWLPKSVSIYKHHYFEGKRMTPREIFLSSAGLALASNVFEMMGVTLENNTEQEIYDLVMEMASIVEGRAVYSRDDELAQRRFWAEFPHTIHFLNAKPLHGKVRMRIGTKFLRQYQPQLAAVA